MKKDLIAIALLLLVSLPTIRDLLIPGAFTSHDLTHHIVRQIDIERLLSEGQFPPRWSGELNNGYGYPLFLFNYPLPALIGHIFHLLGLGYIDSVKAVLGLSLLGSVVTMYLFLRSLLGSRLAAFLGALFYLYAPVRFLNVYVSSALGNSFALLSVPLVFLAINELVKTGKKFWVMGGALSFAALVTSHNVTTVMFAPVIGGFTLLSSLRATERNVAISSLHGLLRRFASRNDVMLMFLLGLGLSAWFWLPSIIEKQYIRYDEYMKGFYESRFVNFQDILYSTWGYGADFSKQIGIGHWLVAGILAVGIMYKVLRKQTKNNKEFLVIGSFSLIVFVISIFLMLEQSKFLWASLPLLEYVQFPHRFLTPAVFASSIMAALLVKYLPFKQLLFVGLLALVLYANRNNMSINQTVEHRDDYYQTLKYSSTAYDEHLPKWARPMTQPSLGKFQVLSGKGVVQYNKNYSSEVEATFLTDEETTLQFNQFYFPGWNITVDGKPAEFNYLMEGESKGLPVFKVTPGTHEIEAKFERTPIRWLADIISLVSLVILLLSFTKIASHSLNKGIVS